MRPMVKLLGITVALFSLTSIYVFATDEDEIDKGRRASVGARRPQVSRPHVRSSSPRPSVSSVRTGRASYGRPSATPSRQVRQQPGVRTPQQSRITNPSPRRDLRIDPNTSRVTNDPNGLLNRMPNGYRPGVFNSPLRGDVAIWTAGRGYQRFRPDSGSTTSTVRPSGQLDNIGSTRLVKPNPFPGPSVEPQFAPNASIGNAVRSPTSNSMHLPNSRSMHRPNSNAFHNPSSLQDLNRVMHRPQTDTSQVTANPTTRPIEPDTAPPRSQEARTPEGLSEDDRHLALEGGLALAVRAAERLAETNPAGRVATTAIGMAPTALHAGQEIGRALNSGSSNVDPGIAAGRASIDLASLGLQGLGYATGQPELALGAPVFQRAGYDVVNSAARAGTRAAEVFNVYDFMGGLRSRSSTKRHVQGEIGSDSRE